MHFWFAKKTKGISTTAFMRNLKNKHITTDKLRLSMSMILFCCTPVAIYSYLFFYMQ